MAAYFDTSAFDHLYKKIGCTAADIANLRKKIYGRELSILLSIHTLEEILLDRRARPELLVAKIKLTLSLGNFRRMVKPCDQLLIDDTRSYASTGEAARPFIDAKVQNVISEGIAALVESDGEELDEDMIAALEEVRERKERFRNLLVAHEEPPQEDAWISFEDYRKSELPRMLEARAQVAGVLESCRKRGFEGLSELPSVRAANGVTLSFAYGQGFQGWVPKGSDFFDLCHVPCAAAVADQFVTDDSRLRQALTRVPLGNLEIIDLPGFLRKIG
jgi:hypothetical protein